jgi:hypothetical protein
MHLKYSILHLVTLLSLWASGFLFAQEKQDEQEKQAVWFPEKCVFPLLEYDLLEVQPYAGIFYMHSNKTDNDAAYIPVNLGFRKPFLQWQWGLTKYDIALGAAAYTQFEIMRFDENTLRGGLLNTDFKASGYLNISKHKHGLRIQLFHISSHLGDDYILRNQNYEPNDKSVNYEQIDVIYLYNLKNAELYFGFGYVVTPNAFRKRLILEAGIQSNISLNPKLDLSVGSDLKLYEENNYSPDIHAGVGLTVKKKASPQISFLIDLYSGHLPYSTLDLGYIFWIGPSCRLYL